MEYLRYPVGLFWLLISFYLPTVFASPPTPTSLPGVEIIDCKRAEELIASEALTIIDTRNPVNFGRGHIPGAKLNSFTGKSANTPDFNRSAHTWHPRQVGAIDHHQPLLIYSHGITGWKSYKAATIARDLGYQRIYWLRGGLAAWKDEGRSIEY